MKRYIEWEEFEQTFPIRLNAQQKSAVQSVKQAGCNPYRPDQ